MLGSSNKLWTSKLVTYFIIWHVWVLCWETLHHIEMELLKNQQKYGKNNIALPLWSFWKIESHSAHISWGSAPLKFIFRNIYRPTAAFWIFLSGRFCNQLLLAFTFVFSKKIWRLIEYIYKHTFTIMKHKFYSVSSLEGWSGIGTDFPGKWWNHHPWKYAKGVWMWHLGIRFSGEHGGAVLMVEHDCDSGCYCHSSGRWATGTECSLELLVGWLRSLNSLPRLWWAPTVSCPVM